VVVMITKDSLFVDGVLVGSLRDVIAIRVPFAPLKTALMAQHDAASAARSNGYCQREVPYGRQEHALQRAERSWLTCSEAEYGKVPLSVVERDGGRLYGRSILLRQCFPQASCLTIAL